MFAGGVGRRIVSESGLSFVTSCIPFKPALAAPPRLPRAFLPGRRRRAAAAFRQPRPSRWAAPRSLSVGYLVGSDRLDDVFTPALSSGVPEEQREAQWVVPAESLPSGDSSLAFSCIELKLHGLYPALPAAQPGAGSDGDLHGVFPHALARAHRALALPRLGRPLRRISRPAGAPVRFLVPTREDGSLAIAFDVTAACQQRGAMPRRVTADFTVDSLGRPAEAAAGHLPARFRRHHFHSRAGDSCHCLLARGGALGNVLAGDERRPAGREGTI